MKLFKKEVKTESCGRAWFNRRQVEVLKTTWRVWYAKSLHGVPCRVREESQTWWRYI